MITSKDNKTVKQLSKLHQKKYRQDSFLLFDEEMILAAKQAGYLKQLVYTGEAHTGGEACSYGLQGGSRDLKHSEGDYYVQAPAEQGYHIVGKGEVQLVGLDLLLTCLADLPPGLPNAVGRFQHIYQIPEDIVHRQDHNYL